MTNQLFGYNGIQDCSDAFRHAYFNALNAKSIGVNLARQFGDAHECEVPTNLTIEKNMDLHNNDVGYQVFSMYSNSDDEDLAFLIWAELEGGGLRYLSPVNYDDPCFWGLGSNPNCSTETHGISQDTELISSTPNCIN